MKAMSEYGLDPNDFDPNICYILGRTGVSASEAVDALRRLAYMHSYMIHWKTPFYSKKHIKYNDYVCRENNLSEPGKFLLKKFYSSNKWVLKGSLFFKQGIRFIFCKNTNIFIELFPKKLLFGLYDIDSKRLRFFYLYCYSEKLFNLVEFRARNEGFSLNSPMCMVCFEDLMPDEWVSDLQKAVYNGDDILTNDFFRLAFFSRKPSDLQVRFLRIE